MINSISKIPSLIPSFHSLPDIANYINFHWLPDCALLNITKYNFIENKKLATKRDGSTHLQPVWGLITTNDIHVI